jgi:hypothetical protein
VPDEGRPGRPEGPLDPAAGAVANLAARLRQLREDAGRPSYRQLARTAYYSHSALSQAAAGRVLPSLAVTLAFVQACGGNRQEWTARWHETAAEAGVLAEPEDHAAGAAPARDVRPAVVARRGIRGRLALVRRRGWYLLAAAGLAGGLTWWGLSAVVTPPAPAHVTGGLAAPVADGAYPSVADCTSWTKTLGSRRVLAGSGQVLGTVQLRYSMRCAAVWARFNPGPSLSAAGAVMISVEVIRHPDGKTMLSRAPYAGRLPRSDILLLHGGCAQASVTVASPGQTPASAVTGCQPPP